jgi:glyoxylate/hydroxypyruvate reductase A
MTILCIESEAAARRWRAALEKAIPGLDVRIWPEAGHRDDIEMVLLWDELDVLASLPNLKAAVILGAGVDHLFRPGVVFPRHLQVARLVDPSITSQMIEYVTLAVLARTRHWDRYRDLQREHRYEELPASVPADVTIGILGLGELGAAAASTLSGIGYRVCGWGRSQRRIDGVECFSGSAGLGAMAAQSDILVCLLPLTEDTRDILNRSLFEKTKRGGYLINAARGGHLVEPDLMAAIEAGQLSGATLDVQRTEPMPDNHPFWDHPAIRITPHIATITSPEYCASQVAENYRRLRAGQKLANAIDPERQY